MGLFDLFKPKDGPKKVTGFFGKKVYVHRNDTRTERQKTQGMMDYFWEIRKGQRDSKGKKKK